VRLLNGPGVGTVTKPGLGTGGWGTIHHRGATAHDRTRDRGDRGEPHPHARSRRDILSAEREAIAQKTLNLASAWSAHLHSRLAGIVQPYSTNAWRRAC